MLGKGGRRGLEAESDSGEEAEYGRRERPPPSTRARHPHDETRRPAEAEAEAEPEQSGGEERSGASGSDSDDWTQAAHRQGFSSGRRKARLEDLAKVTGVKHVTNLRVQLEARAAKGDTDGVLETLGKLDRIPNVSINVLERSRVGLAVNAVRKQSPEGSDARTLARALVRRWKAQRVRELARRKEIEERQPLFHTGTERRDRAAMALYRVVAACEHIPLDTRLPDGMKRDRGAVDACRAIERAVAGEHPGFGLLYSRRVRALVSTLRARGDVCDALRHGRLSGASVAASDALPPPDEIAALGGAPAEAAAAASAAQE